MGYKSASLEIIQLSENSFQHISYLQTESYGKVACNGLIVIDAGEAIVFDTPVNNSDSKELIDWIQDQFGAQVKAVVATHFHVDCTGGLDAFHNQNIASYALNKTIELAKVDSASTPRNGFDNSLELEVGDKKVICEFVGEGHTRDNIVCYFPREQVLFGGCLIKELNAGKGNLVDANIDAWPQTVRHVKNRFADAKIIVPGHGLAGGQELLDYTIELFEAK